MSLLRHRIARRAQLHHLQLTGSLPSGPVVVPGASLRATRAGLTMYAPDGDPVRSWRWALVNWWTADGVARDPAGIHHQVLELQVAGVRHRLLADAADLGAFVRVLAQAVPTSNAGPEARADHGEAGTAEADQQVRRGHHQRHDRRQPGPDRTGRRSGPRHRPSRSSTGQGRLKRWRRHTTHPGDHHRAEGPRIEARRTVILGLHLRQTGIWSRRFAGPAAGLAASGILAASVLAAVAPGLLASTPVAARGTHRANADVARAFGAAALADFHLVAASAPPAPAPPAVAATPLAAHESFGFLPYWALTDPAGVDLAPLTTVAYFSVGVNASGHAVESGPGWTGYQSQVLASMATAAHRGGARVVLTLTCFDQHALDQLTHDPAAQAALAATAVSLVRAKNLDGVNLDFEGQGSADRAGLVRLVGTVASAMHRADAGWQVTVDTYGSSAADTSGFYDVGALAHEVDALVVMAYDMGASGTPGPTAPSTGAGFTDSQVVSEYRAVAPGSSVILGLPLYGYDWPTTGPAAGDPATGPPEPVADDQVAPTDTVYWDPSTGTPWAVYRSGTQWHQIWFDDAPSLAAKARLADIGGLRGVALWALGMTAGAPADIAAALSGTTTVPTPPVGPEVPPGTAVPAPSGPAGAAAPTVPSGSPAAPEGPPGTATGTVPGASIMASGIYRGVSVSLLDWTTTLPAVLPTGASLTIRSTTNTAMACLQDGPPLSVSAVVGWQDGYVVSAATPADCVTGTWFFLLPAAAGSPGTSAVPSSSLGSGTPGSTGGSSGAAGTSAPAATPGPGASSATGSSGSSSSSSSSSSASGGGSTGSSPTGSGSTSAGSGSSGSGSAAMAAATRTPGTGATGAASAGSGT